MSSSDIKLFIDFFYDTALRVRGIKPELVRGKDGKLVKLALRVFSRPQLEMLALWFLAYKPKLAPKIGTMLSKNVLKELSRVIASPGFWSQLDSLSESYFPQRSLQKILSDKHRPFSEHDVLELRNRLDADHD